MREALNLLILLGFLCQGFTFASPLVPAAYALLWYACLRFRRPTARFPNGVEELLTFVAIIAAFAIGGRYAYNRLVSIGNAMVIFQALRLLRPLTIRERMYSVAVALVNLAVGTQVIVNYGFILVLAAVLYLLPRTLLDLELAAAHAPASVPATTRLPPKQVAGVALAMVVFFLAFPRFRVMTPSVVPGTGGPTAREREELRMAAGGVNTPDILLFRIEGENLSYLKRVALDAWDGQKWALSAAGMQPRSVTRNAPAAAVLHRSVRLLNARMLGNALPTDGRVIRVSGTFPQRLYLADHGGVVLLADLHRNISYEYWTVLRDDDTARLNPRDRERYLALPPTSPALRDWLARRLGRVTAPAAVCDNLVRYFQENHSYLYGAPDLDRSAPVDDFVLNRRDGHCERFASALAVLLRLRGIPARVALGWVAAERNPLGDFYNIRTRHGHAWTEAWIAGRGWVIVDATPYGRGIALEDRPLRLTVYEWIEYVWYSKIVEFDVSEQRALLNVAVTRFETAAAALGRHLPLLAGLGFAAVLAAAAWGLRRRRPATPATAVDPEDARRSVQAAQHFYGRLLRLLARQHLRRRASETPLEFLRTVERQGHPHLAEIRDLTLLFCDVRYGNRRFSPDLAGDVQARLARIAQGGRTR